METIAIDIGGTYTDLCRWDGHSLVVEKAATQPLSAGLPDWIARLRPRGACQLLVRGASDGVTVEDLRTMTARLGVGWVRLVSTDPARSPALAVVRQIAERQRGRLVCFAELSAGSWHSGLLSSRGEVVAWGAGAIGVCDADADAAARAAAEWLRAALHETSTDHAVNAASPVLIAYGSTGPAHAARIAERAGLREALVPDHASALAAVGMLIADIHMEFVRPADGSALRPGEMRYGFARLMDEAGEAVTLEGYDTDDTVCERFAEVAPAGISETVRISCEMMADADGLASTARQAAMARFGEAAASGSVELRRLGLAVVVQTAKPALPPQLWGSMRPGDAPIAGPATIQEGDTTIGVPESWHAAVCPSGGVRLQRDERGAGQSSP